MIDMSRDRGAALVLTIGWTAVILLIAGSVSGAVIQQIRKSDNAETSYQALSAAEAGVEDARARLAADGDYWRSVEAYYRDPETNFQVGDDNEALAGWKSIPGGSTEAQFTYFLDTSAAERSGRIRVTSSGRATPDGEIRTVDVLIQKRNSTEYAYLSDSEAFPFDQPGAYGLPGQTTKDVGGVQGPRRMSQDVAEKLCGTGGDGGTRYWYQWANWSDEGTIRPLGPKTSSSLVDPGEIEFGASHRNSVACLFGEVKNGDVFDGPVHTNDVWYIDSQSVCDADPTSWLPECTDNSGSEPVFRGSVSSSCPDRPDPNSPGCPAGHRWIDTKVFQGKNLGQPLESQFVEPEVPETLQSDDPKPWNPSYEAVLEMPSTAQVREIQKFAAEGEANQKGCVFTGPTRIRLGTADGKGMLYVTSPNTQDASTHSFCFGGSSYEPNGSDYDTTVTLKYEEMVQAGFNGVIYVDNVPVEQAPTTPSCVEDPPTKTEDLQGTFPWVSPSPDNDNLSIVTDGFPSADTIWNNNSLKKNDSYDQWTDDPTDECSKGHLYLEAPASLGGYTGQYTIAAARDIVITDDILERSVVELDRTSPAAEELWGVSRDSSDNQLGLVPVRWLYVYHLSSANSRENYNGAIRSQLENLTLNFATLAADKCLAVQDYDSQPEMKTLRLVGSVGQGGRCRVTDPNAGYSDFSVKYDDRLKRLGAPPFMPFLSGEPWAPKSWSETEIRRDAEAKDGIAVLTAVQYTGQPVEYPVLTGAPAGSALLFARIINGVGTVSLSADGSKVKYESPNGVTQTVVEFVVQRPDGVKVGQTLTIDVVEEQ